MRKEASRKHAIAKVVVAQQQMLQQMGVDSEVVQYIMTLPNAQRGFAVNELRKNPKLSLEETQSIRFPVKREDIFEENLSREEKAVMTQTAGDPVFNKWVKIQLAKMKDAHGLTGDDPKNYVHFSQFDTFAGNIRWIHDWYKAEDIEIASYNAETAIAAAKQWHEILAGQKVEGEYSEGTTNVVYGPEWKNEKFNGWTIRKIETEHDLKTEGQHMGHCIWTAHAGEICPKVGDPKGDAYSLRDPNNHPHVSMETEHGGFHFIEISGSGKVDSEQVVQREHRPAITEWIEHLKSENKNPSYEDEEGFNYDRIRRNGDSDELEIAIFGGQDYGFEKELLHWDLEDAHKAVSEGLYEISYHGEMPSDGRYSAEVLARAIIQRDTNYLINHPYYEANTVEDLIKAFREQEETAQEGYWYRPEEEKTKYKSDEEMLEDYKNKIINMAQNKQPAINKNLSKEKQEQQRKFFEQSKKSRISSLQGTPAVQVLIDQKWDYLFRTFSSTEQLQKIEEDENTGDAAFWLSDSIHAQLDSEGIVNPERDMDPDDPEFDEAQATWEEKYYEAEEYIVQNSLPFAFTHAIHEELMKKLEDPSLPTFEKKEWMPETPRIAWMQQQARKKADQKQSKSWYHRVLVSRAKNMIKMAAPKDKIQRFKVTSPTLQSFIHKYEKLVDWNVITSYLKEHPEESTEEVIQAYISQELLENFYDQIRNHAVVNEEGNVEINYETLETENPFLFTPDEIDVEAEIENIGDNQDHQMQQAIQIYRQDPERAKKHIADTVNGNKVSSFFSWIDYLNAEENTVYNVDYAFQYLMVKPIFDKVKKPSKGGAHTANAEAIANVYQNIQDGKLTGNVPKQYKKILVDLEKRGTNFIPSEGKNLDDGWLNIPSRENDPGNYHENISRLNNLSQGTGWCTGTGMAPQYLSEGDFWLYIENNKPSVAIRLVGNDVVEIQGHHNRRPLNYYREIDSLLKRTDYNYEDSKHYIDIQKIGRSQEKIDNILETPSPERDALLQKITDPEMRETMGSGYQAHIYIDETNNIPLDTMVRTMDPKWFKDPEISGPIAKGYMNFVAASDPHLFTKRLYGIPNELIKNNKNAVYEELHRVLGVALANKPHWLEENEDNTIHLVANLVDSEDSILSVDDKFPGFLDRYPDIDKKLVHLASYKISDNPFAYGKMSESMKKNHPELVDSAADGMSSWLERTLAPHDSGEERDDMDSWGRNWHDELYYSAPGIINEDYRLDLDRFWSFLDEDIKSRLDPEVVSKFKEEILHQTVGTYSSKYFFAMPDSLKELVSDQDIADYILKIVIEERKRLDEVPEKDKKFIRQINIPHVLKTYFLHNETPYRKEDEEAMRHDDWYGSEEPQKDPHYAKKYKERLTEMEEIIDKDAIASELVKAMMDNQFTLLENWDYISDTYKDRIPDKSKRDIAVEFIIHRSSLPFNTTGQSAAIPDDLHAYVTEEELAIPYIRMYEVNPRFILAKEPLGFEVPDFVNKYIDIDKIINNLTFWMSKDSAGGRFFYDLERMPQEIEDRISEEGWKRIAEGYVEHAVSHYIGGYGQSTSYKKYREIPMSLEDIPEKIRQHVPITALNNIWEKYVAHRSTSSHRETRRDPFTETPRDIGIADIGEYPVIQEGDDYGPEHRGMNLQSVLNHILQDYRIKKMSDEEGSMHYSDAKNFFDTYNMLPREIKAIFPMEYLQRGLEVVQLEIDRLATNYAPDNLNNSWSANQILAVKKNIPDFLQDKITIPEWASYAGQRNRTTAMVEKPSWYSSIKKYNYG